MTDCSSTTDCSLRMWNNSLESCNGTGVHDYLKRSQLLPNGSADVTVDRNPCQTRTIQQRPVSTNPRQLRDFSIASILSDSTRTTKSTDSESEPCCAEESHWDAEQGLEWLRYTRYTPPKLPRLKRKDSVRKRRLGRNPRVPFSNVQVALLETRFRMTQYVSGTDVMELALALGLTENRVKIWFQNRRARERREKIASHFTTTNFIPVTSSNNRATEIFSFSPQQPMKSVVLTPSVASAFHSVLPSALHCSSIIAGR